MVERVSTAVAALDAATTLGLEQLQTKTCEPTEVNKKIKESFVGVQKSISGIISMLTQSHNHSHSHGQPQQGQQQQQQQHGHSHSHGASQQHGHSHSHGQPQPQQPQQQHGHSHSHGQPQQRPPQQQHGHSHSHGGSQCNHSHSHGQPQQQQQQHGHSHSHGASQQHGHSHSHGQPQPQPQQPQSLEQLHQLHRQQFLQLQQIQQHQLQQVLQRNLPAEQLSQFQQFQSQQFQQLQQRQQQQILQFQQGQGQQHGHSHSHGQPQSHGHSHSHGESEQHGHSHSHGEPDDEDDEEEEEEEEFEEEFINVTFDDLNPIVQCLLSSASSPVYSSFPQIALMLTYFAGSLIETGASVSEEHGIEFIKVLKMIVDGAYKFQFESPEIEPCDHSHGPGENHGHSHSQSNDQLDPTNLGAECCESLTRMCPPSSHFLAYHPSIRKLVQSDEKFLKQMEKLRWIHPGVKMLHTLVNVFDDEPITVIHLEEKKGFTIKISGINDNLQLQTLLMDSLCNLPADQKLSGDSPDQRLIQISKNSQYPQQSDDQIQGNWDFYHWVFATLESEGTLQEKTSYWVWGEGTPSDIVKFRGKRVLLLKKALYQRSWKCVRTFAALDASIKLDHVMSQEEVDNFLTQLNESSSEERKIAMEEIKKSVNKE